MTQWIKVAKPDELTSILGTHMVDTHLYKINIIGYLLKGSVLASHKPSSTSIPNLPYITIFRIQFLACSEWPLSCWAWCLMSVILLLRTMNLENYSEFSVNLGCRKGSES